MLAPVHRWIAGALHTLLAPLGLTKPSGCIIYNFSKIHPLRNAILFIYLPDDRWVIKNKWIFKRKTDVDSSVTIYKARIVAKGFRQVQGVDYDEFFSLVAMLKSVRIMLAIAAFYDYEIWQMDVKTAFLNGFFKEELYMMQPEGFVDPKGANKMCKL